jgi:predicted CopG family antitoxin
MSDIRQQITLQLDAYKDLQALKSAVSEWINQSDVTLPTLEKILAAHSPVDIK